MGGYQLWKQRHCSQNEGRQWAWVFSARQPRGLSAEVKRCNEVAMKDTKFQNSTGSATHLPSILPICASVSSSVKVELENPDDFAKLLGNTDNI